MLLSSKGRSYRTHCFRSYLQPNEERYELFLILRMYSLNTKPSSGAERWFDSHSGGRERIDRYVSVPLEIAYLQNCQ